MRVEERCKCGAQIIIIWDGEGRYQREHEPRRSAKELENFRRRHKPCIAAPAPTVIYQPQPSTFQIPAAPVSPNVC